MIAKSGAAEDRARRAGPEGLSGRGVDRRPVQPYPAAGPLRLWTTFREVATEVIDARRSASSTKDLDRPLRVCRSRARHVAVEQGHVGVLFEDGRYVETLPPGKYAFWKNMAKSRSCRWTCETMLDIGGQEIMTADKVTLRLNAVATYQCRCSQGLSVRRRTNRRTYREACWPCGQPLAKLERFWPKRTP